MVGSPLPSLIVVVPCGTYAVSVILLPPPPPWSSGSGAVHVVLLLPPERQPVRYCPRYGIDSKTVRCLSLQSSTEVLVVPTLQNLQHGTSCIGSWTCDCIGRKLKLLPCGTYAVLVILPPMWSCGSGVAVHVVLVVY